MIRRRLIVGTLSNVGGRVSGVVTWFLLTPFVLTHIGPTGYALWTLLTALSSYGMLLDFGVSGAVVKYVAEHTARGERAAARVVIASAMWLYSGLAVMAVGLSVLVAPALPSALGVASGERQTAALLVMLAGVNVATLIAFAPVFATIRGLQRHDLYNGVKAGLAVPEAAGMILVLLAGWSVTGMIGVCIAINLTAGLVSRELIRAIAPELVPTWRGATLTSVRRITAFSVSAFTIEVAGRLRNRTDEFVIALFGTLSSVTAYALARKLSELTALVAVQFLKVVMPLASELEAADQGQKLRKLYIVASRLALAAAAPVAVVLMIVGDEILLMWVGPAYVEHAPLLVVLALSAAVTASQWPAIDVLQGLAKHRVVAAASLGAGIANVGLAIVLLPSLGLLGVALATLIPGVIVSLGIVMPFANSTLHVSWDTALRKIWLPVLVPAAMAGIVLAAAARQVDASTPAGLAISIAAAALTYVILYLGLPGTGPERQLAIDLVAGGSQRLRGLRPGLSRLG